jgi:hypothetical protein
MMCRYFMEWQRSGMPYSTYCAVDEPVLHGHANCMENSQSAFNGIILRASSSPCAIFDSTAVAQNIFRFVAGESQEGLVGLIQFSAASSQVSSFRAIPMP